MFAEHLAKMLPEKLVDRARAKEAIRRMRAVRRRSSRQGPRFRLFAPSGELKSAMGCNIETRIRQTGFDSRPPAILSLYHVRSM